MAGSSVSRVVSERSAGKSLLLNFAIIESRNVACVAMRYRSVERPARFSIGSCAPAPARH
jgi:hypothetical protein